MMVYSEKTKLEILFKRGNKVHPLSLRQEMEDKELQ